MSEKKKITNLIIVDGSGSMATKLDTVKGGITELMQSIRTDMKENKDATIRTIICQFSNNGKFKVLLDTKKRKALKNATIAEDYQPDGLTALYDAIGTGFNMVGKKQDGVFVNILTDGLENDSKEYTKENVIDLIAKAKKKSWGITFMGTTEQAINNATSLGISKSNTFRYANTSSGTAGASSARTAGKSLYLQRVMKAKKGKKVSTDNLMENQEENNN